MRHLTCPQGVEIIGSTMISIIENLQSQEIQPLLVKHNLTEIEKDLWYPAEQWLSVMNDMADNPNLTSNYVAVGMEISQNLTLPKELEEATLIQILEMWNNIYQLQHRGGDIGLVTIEKIEEEHYRTIHRHIYPDDLTYGIAYGFCRRFLPKGTPFTVKYEELSNRLDNGGNDETVILIKWG